MIYVEISCNDCKADLGYGSAINSDGICKCKYCGSEDLNETSYYDD